MDKYNLDDLHFDQLVKHWATLQPDDLALETISKDMDVTSLTWREFEVGIQNTAHHMKKKLGEDEKIVGIVCNDDFLFHFHLHAAWRCGLAVLLIDRNWGDSLLNDTLETCGCRTVYSVDGADVSDHINDFQFIPQGDTVDKSDEIVIGRHSSLAFIATTSGTTSMPKCIPITHKKIRAAYKVCLKQHDIASKKKFGCLYNINSLGILGMNFLLTLEVGSTTRQYLQFSLVTAKKIWIDMMSVESGVEFVYLVPPIVRLLNTLKITLPVLQHQKKPILAFTSSSPIDTEEMQKFESLYPVRMFNAYGLTELCFAVFFGTRDNKDKATNSIGKPVGIKVRLKNNELHITGPMATKKYLNNPVATTESWDNEWLCTGDIAHIDDQGNYFIVGRLKDVALRGGNTRYLYEWDHYANKFPDVIEACAFVDGVSASGDVVRLALSVNESFDEALFKKYLIKELGNDRIPDQIIVTNSELPRNSNGKVSRPLVCSVFGKK